MSCHGCGSGNTSDFSQKDRQHIYCHRCGGHLYEHQWFDKGVWDDWVNERIERPAREEQLDIWEVA